MTSAARRDDPDKPGLAGIESLLGAGLALGLFFTSIRLASYGPSDRYIRVVALGISFSAVALALIAGLARRRAKIDAFVGLAVSYFVWAGIQDVAQSDALAAVLDLFGAALSLGASRATLNKTLSGLRRWILIVIVADLLPALAGQGFSAGRVWFGLLPGRYFGFSNPDALGFIAGLGILLSIPVWLRGRGWILTASSGLLFAITASYSSAIAIGFAVAVYFLLTKTKIKIKATSNLQYCTTIFAIVTVGLLIWIPTDQGIRAFESLQQRLDLSNRTLIWVELLHYARGTGYFWTGLGDRTVGNYAVEIADAGSAHATILQMLLSKGFITTVFFVLVAAIAVVRSLGRCCSEPSSQQRLALAVMVYWFVTSLVSTQPGTPVGFSLVIAVAISQSEAESRAPSRTRGDPGTSALVK